MCVIINEVSKIKNETDFRLLHLDDSNNIMIEMKNENDILPHYKINYVLTPSIHKIFQPHMHAQINDVALSRT